MQSNHHPTPRRAVLAVVLATFTLHFPGNPLRATGLYQGGSDARTAAMGGTGAAAADGPIASLFENPAALGGIGRVEFQSSVQAGAVQGDFHNRANRSAELLDAAVIGATAFVIPFGPLRFGFGVNPDIAQRARWSYRDTPGGADGRTSYGDRAHESDVLLLRTALGVGWNVSPTFSLGASVGFLYNHNRLQAPYIFQRQPTLRTVKVLLDLEADGFGWNGQFGARWQPAPGLTLSATYTTPARIEAEGDAHGNAGEQFRNLGLGAARPDFAYRDATVINHFPQQASLGATWEPRAGLLLSVQGDWINWSDSFDTLGVRLRGGNNADINGLVGSNRLNDQIPLRWRDTFVGRVGAEQRLGANWAVRAGYSYGNNPVPPGTLTPLTAAITEHTIDAGVGYHRGRWSVDAAFRWDLPATGRVRRSDLADGEYSDSVVGISAQWLTLTAKRQF